MCRLLLPILNPRFPADRCPPSPRRWLIWGIVCLFHGLATAQDAVADASGSAEASEAPLSSWHLAVSGGFTRYSESHMRLSGPEVGLHASTGQFWGETRIQWEGDALLGRLHYDSDNSGSMDRVANVETRWRLRVPMWGAMSIGQGWSTGIALHTLWNDLRGVTTSGHLGYQRTAVQWWLPLRWDGPSGEYVDTGMLIYGRHRSSLSQAAADMPDVINTQRRGLYTQLGHPIPSLLPNHWVPFLRMTYLGDSQHLQAGPWDVSEPASRRWQLGLSVSVK